MGGQAGVAVAEVGEGPAFVRVGLTEFSSRRMTACAAPDRLEALSGAVAAWAADIDAGQDSRLLAWRRRDVADLNRLARASASLRAQHGR